MLMLLWFLFNHEQSSDHLSCFLKKVKKKKRNRAQTCTFHVRLLRALPRTFRLFKRCQEYRKSDFGLFVSQRCSIGRRGQDGLLLFMISGCLGSARRHSLQACESCSNTSVSPRYPPVYHRAYPPVSEILNP